MRLEFFGQEDQQVSGSIIYEPGIDTPLAPCPFCGGHAGLEVVNTWTPAYSVRCNDCGAEGPSAYSTTGRVHWKTERSAHRAHRLVFAEAIALWNGRATKKEQS